MPAEGRTNGGSDRRQPVGRGVGKQVVLPWSKAIEISLNSLRIRFWRSLITTGGIILAVAFLMAILTKSAVVSAVKAVSDPRAAIAVQKAGEEAEEERASGAGKWLAVLGLLVALVGITNAQLMSVTERFREIGTMKCLGALDSFVVRLFLLESAFQGVAGAAAGVATGYCLISIKLWLDYAAVWSAADFRYPWPEVGASAAFCLAVGLGISVLAAIYPAYVAAKMEPVVAMRV
ncbi:MAG: FtsX-like permease family protein, partial [Planctomycetota bacterium]|nr:FtsX-like permease family protein [Planctomycetota bacterium]